MEEKSKYYQGIKLQQKQVEIMPKQHFYLLLLIMLN
jgi:hypothetical protein